MAKTKNEAPAHEETSFSDRVNPPATFDAGYGTKVKVWAASGKQQYPNAVIEQSYHKDNGEWVTNKVYIDNRSLLSVALACQDAHREVSRQFQQSRSQGRSFGHVAASVLCKLLILWHKRPVSTRRREFLVVFVIHFLLLFCCLFVAERIVRLKFQAMIQSKHQKLLERSRPRTVSQTIVLMSLRLAILCQVGLHQSPTPLRQSQ